MDYKIEKIELDKEFKDCPACGYRDGFHSMLKKKGDATCWLLICPSCHRVFDVGLTV